MVKNLLTFGKGNSKLTGWIATFSIPAGHSCPGANECLSKAIQVGDKWKIQDGPDTRFRCFTAADEARYPAVRNARWHNFNLLKACKSVTEMADLICESLPTSKNIKAIRIHVAGDFFSFMYFDAWVEVAKRNPNQTFYAYTKSIHFWVKRMNTVPANLFINGSVGGKFDSLIEEFDLKSAQVVYSVKEAEALGLEIDHDDSHAYTDGPSFALLLHGMQPKGSEAGEALKELRKQGIGGYGKDKSKRAAVKA